MENLRWYDKDRYLSAFMSMLDKMSVEAQSKVAIDILNAIPKVIGSDCESFMKLVEKNDPKKYNRSYDKNPYLHSVHETLKNLKDNEREALYEQISDIMQTHTEIDLTGLKIKHYAN